MNLHHQYAFQDSEGKVHLILQTYSVLEKSQTHLSIRLLLGIFRFISKFINKGTQSFDWPWNQDAFLFLKAKDKRYLKFRSRSLWCYSSQDTWWELSKEHTVPFQIVDTWKANDFKVFATLILRHSYKRALCKFLHCHCEDCKTVLRFELTEQFKTSLQ